MTMLMFAVQRQSQPSNPMHAPCTPDGAFHTVVSGTRDSKEQVAARSTCAALV
jgi:hypothetical protein